MEKHIVTAENVPLFLDWLAKRGGIAIWRSINLSNPGMSWSTPVNTADGQPMSKPDWQAENQPSRIITDPTEILVSIDKEVKRFHVAIRRGSQGFTMKCTDGASRKIRAAVEKAGKGAYYEFDYSAQEAVIFAPDKQIPLPEWKAEAA